MELVTSRAERNISFCDLLTLLCMSFPDPRMYVNQPVPNLQQMSVGAVAYPTLQPSSKGYAAQQRLPDEPPVYTSIDETNRASEKAH